EDEFEIEDDHKFHYKYVLIFMVIILFSGFVWSSLKGHHKDTELIVLKDDQSFIKIGDASVLQFKIVNQDKIYLYIESQGESFQLVKQLNQDYLNGDLMEVEVKYIGATQFSEVKILEILKVKSINNITSLESKSK
ncbi:hypothetical protein MJH12_13105, partial [bacterium]|nr:hypothetical protein [bacterium]